jgi:lipopolysaccharide biosynthesis protein
MKDTKLFVILGMHRSGTSVVSRGLKVLGVDLGNRLIVPDKFNPKGYWEDLDINQFNDEVLQALNMSWHSLSPIQQSDVDLLNREGFVLRADNLLRSKARGISKFGFKDPRTTKLLPFWKPIFTRAGFQVHYILVFRNPLSVSSSLTQRDGFDFEKSYLMWSEHVISSIHLTEGESRVFVDFDALVQSPEKELAKIGQEFNLQVDGHDLEIYRKEFLDNSMRHTVFMPDDLGRDSGLPPLMAEIYEHLQEIAGENKQEKVLSKKVEDWKNEFARFKPALVLSDKLEKKIAEGGEQLLTLTDQMGKRDADIETLSTQLGERDTRLQIMTGRLEERDRQIAERDAQWQKLSDQLAVQEEKNQLVVTQLDSSNLELEQLKHTAPYRFLMIYRRILNRVLPEGTPWRGSFDILIRGIKTLVFDGPRAFWKKLKTWRTSRNAYIGRGSPRPGTRDEAARKYAQVIKEIQKHSSNIPDPEFVPLSQEHFPARNSLVKTIAFYLPQFHPIPENDEWWGKGFTEWTNVSKATSQFVGHYQPRLPGELNYYDLRIPEVMRRQIDLAKQYGLYGFCFHYYWFNGKRLLERPLEQFLADKQIDFPFCISWANENWTRRWDGLEDDVLIAQRHSAESDLAFIRDVAGIFEDRRYIRVDGKPMLIVYRANSLPNARETGARWRNYCREKGLGEIYLVAAQTFGFRDPISIGFDAAVEFPPLGINHKLPYGIGNLDLINPEFSGHVLKYPLAVGEAISAKDTPYTLFRGLMPGWDNTARTGPNARIFLGSTPFWYQTWLSACREYAIQHNPEQARFVFINSWNEWAEGAYLEPDRKFGYAFLQATANALFDENIGQQSKFEKRVKKSETAVILHLFYPELWEEIRGYLERLNGDFDLYVSIAKNDNQSAQVISEKFPDAFVLEIDNRGRDIAPFLEIFRHIYPMGYKYVCKIHTKKSPHRIDGDVWRRDLLGKLLGSQRTVNAIKASLDNGQFGLVAPAGHMLDANRQYGANRQWLERLRRKLGFDLLRNPAQFAAGSMFWFKPQALFPMLHLPIRLEDFEFEQGSVDGTLAHALERVIGILPGQIGYRLGVSNRHGVFSPGSKTSGYRFTDPRKRIAQNRGENKITADPILVYQMGRVGSKTMVDSLASWSQVTGSGLEIHHVHVLANLDEMAESIKRERISPRDTLAQIKKDKALKEKIEANRDRRWNIISLVRDPVARNISTFFFNLPELLPEWQNRLKTGKLSPQQLWELFSETESIHRAPIAWFDSQLKSVTGIDIFARSFPREKGYEIYTRDSRFNVLVIRLEDLDRCAENALRDFLGIEGFKLKNTNRGSEMGYSDLYKEFVNQKIPSLYLDRMYASQYARHFYSEEEIREFKRKWSGSKDKSGFELRAPTKSSNGNENRMGTDPIIVFQMGKVGSRSMVISLRNSLKHSSLDVNVYHIHMLEGIDEYERQVVPQRKVPAPLIEHLDNCRKLKAKIDADKFSRWNIISLVREPVSRNISTFFQVLPEEFPDWRTRYETGNLTIQMLQDMFLSRTGIHQGAENWFEGQLRPLTQVNVFDLDFSKEKGYQIYENGSRFRVLLLRMEDLDKVAKTAVKQFIGLDHFQLIRENESSNKDYFEIYEAFKRFPFPADYIDRAYSSKYVRHFYTAEEIERFRRKWTAKE